MNRWRTLSLFLVVVCVVFAAGITDILCPDVIPVRPYTSFFLTNLQNPTGTSLPAFWNGIDMVSIILPVVAIIILVLFPLHGLTVPPLIIGHGKSETSHRWHGKLTKRIVAKKILKQIRKGNSEPKTSQVQTQT